MFLSNHRNHGTTLTYFFYKMIFNRIQFILCYSEKWLWTISIQKYIAGLDSVSSSFHFFSCRPSSWGVTWVMKIRVNASTPLFLNSADYTDCKSCILLPIATVPLPLISFVHLFSYNSALHECTRKILVLHYTVSRIYTE